MFNPVFYLSKTKLLQGDQALDLGCGPGLVTGRLVEHGFKVDAVDINPQEIEVESSVGSVNFIQADIRDFKIKESFYDVIIAKNALSFLSSREEVEETVARMYAGLKTGGIMYFSLFGTRDPWVKERPHMIFIDDFLPPGKSLYKSEECFYGPIKTTGQCKNWHIYNFVVEKV